jgi:hypothetical protein
LRQRTLQADLAERVEVSGARSPHIRGFELDSPLGNGIIGVSDNLHGGVCTMTWETPDFVEVRMDAEMTAYADDLDGI